MQSCPCSGKQGYENKYCLWPAPIPVMCRVEEEEEPWTSPSLGGTEYSGPSLSVSKEEKELSETHAADGDSMKLGLKGISVSWWETGEGEDT